MMTVRDAAFDLFRAFGMTTFFGNPGSTELPMFRDFPADFTYVLGLQESIVVGMADGYAQATRRAALVNLHSAAGVGHAMGNLFTAYKNQSPLVVTAGQQARSLLAHEPYLHAKNATQLPAPYVKWACEPARAEDVPAALAHAYYVSMQPPRGPTFVSIPVDDWDRPGIPVSPRVVSSTLRGDPALLAAIAAALDAAQSPVVVVGAAVARDAAWEEIILLAERHEAPVWVSPLSGRNSFPEDHRLFAGFLPAAREGIVTALNRHDCILVAGAPAFTYHIEGRGPFIPPGAGLFLLTDDPVAAASAPTGTAVVASLKSGLRDLLDVPLERRRARVDLRRPRAPLTAEPLTDAYVMQRIAALRPWGSVVVEEAPSSRQAMHEQLPMMLPDTFYTCASGGLGHGLPAAVGIALARTDKVIAILGDGSALYSVQGLWNAAQLELTVCFVILNNRRYEALVRFGRHFGIADLVGTELPDIDFCAIAAGFGVEAARVSTADELDAALAAAFGSTHAALVEIVLP